MITTDHALDINDRALSQLGFDGIRRLNPLVHPDLVLLLGVLLDRIVGAHEGDGRHLGIAQSAQTGHLVGHLFLPLVPNTTGHAQEFDRRVLKIHDPRVDLLLDLELLLPVLLNRLAAHHVGFRELGHRAGEVLLQIPDRDSLRNVRPILEPLTEDGKMRGFESGREITLAHDHLVLFPRLIVLELDHTGNPIYPELLDTNPGDVEERQMLGFLEANELDAPVTQIAELHSLIPFFCRL